MAVSAAAVDVNAAWVDGWNAGVTAAAAVLSASDLPIEIRDRSLALVVQLLTD